MNESLKKKDIAIVAITKKGIEIAKSIRNVLSESEIYVPEKFRGEDPSVIFFPESVTDRIGPLFHGYASLICVFSLGAVIRLISPHLKDKKNDPAVIVIDDTAKFVISTLSGHLGGANELTLKVADILNSVPVITTAADVNKTIAIDLLGKKFDWVIDNFENVTKVSAMMVNEERIGAYQDAGEKNWWNMDQLPKNVVKVPLITSLLSDEYRGSIIITDKLVSNKSLTAKSVIYRPKSLYVGIGLHWNTSKDTIQQGIIKVLEENKLSIKSIKAITSLDKGKHVVGLDEFCTENNLPLLLFSKTELNEVIVPNPSDLVGKYEGTSSVSEASSLAASKGILIVPKQKFPPDLTVAICRVNYQ
ncbi:MAG: cobalamin biosynthesis protein [Candidatus Nitrosocosmicus sp.]|nr:cobalamin biosynthesis protein [Candidatus Nitrosocosmicus sp.]MDN5866759.1 cobalamin biosynthesis protein [Candidatus Nitrosocosmicus sp.]